MKTQITHNQCFMFLLKFRCGSQEKMIELGVDAIISDYPDRVVKALEN